MIPDALPFSTPQDRSVYAESDRYEAHKRQSLVFFDLHKAPLEKYRSVHHEVHYYPVVDAGGRVWFYDVAFCKSYEKKETGRAD